MGDTKGKTASKPAEVAEVPEGHRRVRYIYNPDNSLMGKVVDLPAEVAAMLVAENRVAYVDPATPLDADGDGIPDDQDTDTAPPPVSLPGSILAGTGK